MITRPFDGVLTKDHAINGPPIGYWIMPEPDHKFYDMHYSSRPGECLLNDWFIPGDPRGDYHPEED